MTLKTLSKIMLFFNSYSFFFILIILKVWRNEKIPYNLALVYTITFACVIFISLIFTITIISHAKSNVDTFLKIKKIKESQINMLGYIFSYIVPFINLDLSNIYDLSIMIILIFVIAFYYIKSNLFHLNPTLNMFGYKISKVITEDDKIRIIIFKNNKINEEISIKAKMISKNIFVGEINDD